ncbi:MAG: MlaD family protein [Anaerolineae bacterium]
MGEQTKNMLIGVFVLVACSLIISIIMFLKPSVGDAKKTLYVRFSNINKINIGTRVTFAGKPVGEVVAISQLYDARAEPADSLGQIYFYQLTLKVDSSVNVYNTDEISLQTSGLLGEKSVAIIPKAPPKGVIPKLITDQPIYATSVDAIENTFKEISDVATNVEETIHRINKWIDQHGEDLASTIKSAGDAMNEIKVAVNTMNQEHILIDVKAAIQNFSSTMHLASQTLDQMRQDAVFTNFSDVMKNLKSASGSIDTITQDLADGTGTLGKLIKGDDLYLRLTAIMSKADTLMNDINHYGILFHLNKNWQRLRTQRIDLLNALETPSSFKNYFETEVDQINTAMSRLSMLVDRAAETPQKEEILKSANFKKDFIDLLQQVDQLGENLRLYNEQLMEKTAN